MPTACGAPSQGQHTDEQRQVHVHAFGKPGSAPTWTSSAKDLVGCALGPARLWFTSGFDIPQVRDLGFIVADDGDFSVEVKRTKACRAQVLTIPKSSVDTFLKDSLAGIRAERFLIIPGGLARAAAFSLRQFPGIFRANGDRTLSKVYRGGSP